MRKISLVPADIGTSGLDRSGDHRSASSQIDPEAEGYWNFHFPVRWIALTDSVNQFDVNELDLKGASSVLEQPFGEASADTESNLPAVAGIDSSLVPYAREKKPQIGRWQMVVPEMVRPINRQVLPKRVYQRPQSRNTMPLSRDSALAHYRQAVFLHQCDQWERAIEEFDRALEPEQTCARISIGIGACLLRLNRFDEALSIFGEDCVDQEQELWRFGRAVSLHLLRRLDEAAREYEVLLESCSNVEEILSNLVALNVERGNLDLVRRNSNQLLAIRANSVVALQGLATVAMEEADGRSACVYCDRILALSPGCLEAWHNFRIAVNRWRWTPLERRSGL